MKDNFGDWDLPGGRIKKEEFETSLEQVITRKLKQEVGGSVTYTLGRPIVFMRHQRVENSTKEVVRIFAIGYQAEWTGGDVETSERHTEILWADPQSFKPADYFTGGWLRGVEDYLSIIRSSK